MNTNDMDLETILRHAASDDDPSVWRKEIAEAAGRLNELTTALDAWMARAQRAEIERDQFALDARANAQDAARYRFIRSRWQFSDAEVDRKVDADMAAEKAADESEAQAWGIDAANRADSE